MNAADYGLTKAQALVALYEGSQPMGMGFLQARSESLTEKEAEDIVARQPYIDYLFGRPIKIDFRKDDFDPSLYERDNGSADYCLMEYATRLKR
jgi:hypothetical protein